MLSSSRILLNLIFPRTGNMKEVQNINSPQRDRKSGLIFILHHINRKKEYVLKNKQYSPLLKNIITKGIVPFHYRNKVCVIKFI